MRQESKSPFRIGWESAKANVVPMIVLSCLTLVIVVGYYDAPVIAKGLNPLARWQDEWGWMAALVGSMLSALEPSFASSVERSVACARQKAKDATVRIEEARKDSRRRGAWCMTPWGVGNRNWEDSARFLKECGVRFVAPCMANAASSCYHSSVLNERPAVKNDGDALEQCLSACHRHGLECHVWKMNFTFSPSADPDFSRQMEEEERLQVGSSGGLRRD